MKRRKFLIGVSAAGLSVPFIARAELSPVRAWDKASVDHFDNTRRELFASHRSHSSHKSHGSHRSSSGGGSAVRRRSSPTRRSNSTPSSSILPRSSSSSTPLLSAESFTDTAKRVQRGLKAFGYYDGAIDGIIGKSSRAALKTFQTDFSLKVTGTITPEVLKALGIS